MKTLLGILAILLVAPVSATLDTNILICSQHPNLCSQNNRALLAAYSSDHIQQLADLEAEFYHFYVSSEAEAEDTVSVFEIDISPDLMDVQSDDMDAGRHCAHSSCIHRK